MRVGVSFKATAARRRRRLSHRIQLTHFQQTNIETKNPPDSTHREGNRFKRFNSLTAGWLYKTIIKQKSTRFKRFNSQGRKLTHCRLAHCNHWETKNDKIIKFSKDIKGGRKKNGLFTVITPI